MTNYEQKIDDIISTHSFHVIATADDETTESADRLARQAIDNLVRESQLNPFDFVEPCEENCSPERHAYHQGQWDMASRMQERTIQLQKEGEHE